MLTTLQVMEMKRRVDFQQLPLSRCCLNFAVRIEKQPRASKILVAAYLWLFRVYIYIWHDKLPSYVWITINHDKDPCQTTNKYNGTCPAVFFFRGSFWSPGSIESSQHCWKNGFRGGQGQQKLVFSIGFLLATVEAPFPTRLVELSQKD